jgi:hypothetical protein
VKRPKIPLCDLLSQHANEDERREYAEAVLSCNTVGQDRIIAQIKRRLRTVAARKPSTKRVDAATGKLIVRYGKQQVIDSIGRWVPPEDRPTVSAGD